MRVRIPPFVTGPDITAFNSSELLDFPPLGPRGRYHTIPSHSCPTPTLSQNMQSESDNEFYDLKLSSCESKLRRNERTSTYRLPPELLLRIFGACTSDSREFNVDNLAVLIKVTHVCKRWRELAIAYPFLWTYIDLRFPGRAEEMIRRSKPAPLTIRIHIVMSPNPSWIASAQLVLGELYRTRHLNMSFVLGYGFEKVIGQTVLVAPLLETLTLNGHYMRGRSDAGIPFVSELVSRNVKHLRAFESQGPYFSPATLNSMRGLTRLIFRIYFPSPTQLTFEQLLPLLENSPAIEHLELATLSIWPPSSTMRPIQLSNPRVVLAHLKYLHLWSHAEEDTVELLESILFPPTTKIDVHYVPMHSNPVNAVRLFNRISKSESYIQPEYTIPIRSLSVLLGISMYSVLKIWTEKITFSHTYDVSPLISLEIALGASERTSLNLICDNLPFHNLQSLFVGGQISNMQRVEDVVIDADMWLSVLQSMPIIQDLTVFGRSALFFIEAFGRSLVSWAVATKSRGRSTASCSIELPFPCLRYLGLQRTDLEFVQPSPLTALMVDTTEALRDLLTLGYEFGLEINKLSLSECRHVLEKDIALFREIVVDVEWDGLINPELASIFHPE